MAGTEPSDDSKKIYYSVFTSEGERLSGRVSLREAARVALTHGGQEYQIRGAYPMRGSGPQWIEISDEQTLSEIKRGWVADQRDALRLGCRVARVAYDAGDTAGFLMITLEGQAAWARTERSEWGKWDDSLWLLTLEDGRTISPSGDYRLWVRNPSAGRNEWGCTWISASIEPSQSITEAETVIFQRVVFGDEWSDAPMVLAHSPAKRTDA